MLGVVSVRRVHLKEARNLGGTVRQSLAAATLMFVRINVVLPGRKRKNKKNLSPIQSSPFPSNDAVKNKRILVRPMDKAGKCSPLADVLPG